MPTLNKLTDNNCRKAAKGKHFDGAGLYLHCTATAKTWRMAYRIAGKPQTATFGPYPLVNLSDARVRRDELRRKLLSGDDPRSVPTRQAPGLREAWVNYWAARQDISESYRANALRGLELHLAEIGRTPVSEVTREQLLVQLNRMAAAGKLVFVRRVRMWVSQVFDWAVEQGYRIDNPAASIRPAKAFAAATVESHAALGIHDVPDFMRRLDMEGHLQSAIALRLLALTWVRTNELRHMRWDEIRGQLWTIPAGKMKRRREHLVPLNDQAIKLLATMRERHNSEYVFPADHRLDRPMSENAMLYLIGRMGYGGRMTGHGWRTVASTWANDLGYPPDAIERQLAHVPGDRIRAVYNRALYMDDRRRMLADWGVWVSQANTVGNKA